MSEIPASIRPRIAKLHGSLPANGPLIFTEEDYRTYPSQFAPFVNLVQPSMMENVFCLIGFSGDDPNFLHWSGWVRDNLGSSAPKIYLVGWLDLSPHRRRMLEDRNVVPVDLARLPQGRNWPEHLNHRYAIEWFLWNLRDGEPYRAFDWPSPRVHRIPSVPAHLGYGPPIRNDYPLEEEDPPGPHSKEQLLEAFRKVIPVWRRNRHLYPGWVIAPYDARFIIYHCTRSWLHGAKEILSSLMPLERLSLLREIVWRLDICLIPLTSYSLVQELASEIECSLLAVDPIGRVFVDSGVWADVTEVEWESTRKDWAELAMAILRYYRETRNSIKFEEWIGRLSPYLHARSEFTSAVNYERCLLALSCLDYQTLDKILDEWVLNEVDHICSIRKAAILAETGRLDEAHELARKTLEEIRRRTRKDTDDIPLFSREGWAMYLLLGFDGWRVRERHSSKPERYNSFSRWEALAVYKCDAWHELDRLEREIEKDCPSLEPMRKEEAEFDLGLRMVWRRYQSDDSREKLLPAYQFKRLVEVAGIPPIVDHIVLAEKGLLRAAFWLASEDPQAAMSLLLRTGSSADEVFKRFFTRSRIALLTDQEVQDLVGMLEAAIDYATQESSRGKASQDYKLGRLRVVVELLSRLVLRFSETEAEQLLARAIRFHSMEPFRAIWMHEPLDHLLKRSMEAVPPSRRGAFILPLISLPLLGEEGVAAMHDRRPEPLDQLHPKTAGLVRPPSPSEWDDAIQRLLSGVQRQSPTRPREILRLVRLHEWGLLNAEEVSRFAAGIWGQVAPWGLPTGTRLQDWDFLILPEPEPGHADATFRQAYLNAEGDCYRNTSTDHYLYQLGGAINRLKQAGRPFPISESEAELILVKIRHWASQQDAPSSQDRSKEDKFVRSFHEAVLGLAEILPALQPKEADSDAIWQKLSRTDGAIFPSYLLYPVLLRLRPLLFEELSFRFRIGLASGDKRVAALAISGLGRWLREGKALKINPPPDDMVREVGVSISVRRLSNLQEALDLAEWLFRNEPEIAQQSIADLTEHGLNYLLEEASYRHEYHRAQLDPEDIPLIRAGCVKLVLAMRDVGLGDRQAVEKWLQAGLSDPLPEVRHLIQTSGEDSPTAI
jgi:hypothetical protein